MSSQENKFSHVKPVNTTFTDGGLRDFFVYRDLGIAEATGGKVIAHMVVPTAPPRRASAAMSISSTCSRARQG
ncbi:hypothetical protein CBM2634_U180001 [Cupriavidus taiwanensis]|uniref:Uncharacterized protein n=1 Tax=Cupriavidus taiwanensis TaxID=164546 RepID=A0A375JBK5_9BURK|nr:hypothetical protein CBM2634_U180001 [Cupriavidus taiwanensis]